LSIVVKRTEIHVIICDSSTIILSPINDFWQNVVSLDSWCSSGWFTSHSCLVGEVQLPCAVVVQFTC
jgi:hypothetical protein